MATDADADDAAMTLRQLWDETADALGARHEARWMCEVASNLDADEFDAHLNEGVGHRVVAHLDAMLARYRTGEPLQYVLGRWGFRHLDLMVDRRVLIPRPETELVADVAIGLARACSPRRVADLGTGSGAIGLSMATELPLDDTEVWLTDASTDALDVARANLAGIGRAARNVTIAEGEWFAALPDQVLFDVIVSNPPYVSPDSPDIDVSVTDWEPAAALFSPHNGMADIVHLIKHAPTHLATAGWLVLEIGADQGRATAAVCTEHGYVNIDVRQDLAGHDRVVIAQRQPG